MKAMADHVEQVLSNLTMRRLLRLQFVSAWSHEIFIIIDLKKLTVIAAKFTGYQYGGRPLGITFVRYVHPSGAGSVGDVGDESAGITQDQMM